MNNQRPHIQRPHVDNESDEAQARADIDSYSSTLVDTYGFDPELISDFVDYAEALGSIKGSKYYSEPNPVYKAGNLESVLLATNHSFKPRYGHLNTREKGRSRGSMANSSGLMDSLGTLYGEPDQVMLYTKAVQVGAAYANHNASTPFSFLIKSKKLIDTQEATSKVVAHNAQMELLMYAQDCVDAIKMVGSRRAGAMATQLMMDYVPQLTHLNPEMALYLVASMIDTLKDAEKAETKPTVKALYNDMSIKLAAALEYVTTSGVLDRFVLPVQETDIPVLDVNTNETLEPQPDETTTTGDTIPIEPETMPEVIKETPGEVLVALDVLKQEIDTFNRYWFDIGRKWRDKGFAGLMEDIVRKKELFDKVGAPQMIGFLGRINESALRGSDEAIIELTAAQDTRTKLSLQRESLIDKYGQYPEVRQFSKSFFMINIASEAHDARQKWLQLSDSIRQQWPRFEGVETAQRIQGVLFHDEYKSDDVTEMAGRQDEELYDSQQVSLIDTKEIDTLRELIGQLDEIILPPGMTEQHLIQQLKELGVERPDEINWEKFKDLIEITKDFGGKIYRSKMRGNGQSEDYGEVYYVSVFELYGKRFAVAESPMIDNATYVIDETHTPGSWIEMLTMTKSQVRELGGKQIIHSAASPYGPLHREKVYKYIFDVSADQ